MTGFWRFDLPGGESTSAALRRVEQERDELADELAMTESANIGAECELELALRQRDKFVAAADKLHDSWLALKAELASAHQELDAVRTARDNLDAALAHTRRQLGDAVQELMDGIPGTTHTGGLR